MMMRHISAVVAVLLIQLSYTGIKAEGKAGLLYTTQNSSSNFTGNGSCINYNEKFASLPTGQHTIVNLLPWLSCSQNSSDAPQPLQINNTIVIVQRGNCSFADKAELVQGLGAVAVIIASEKLGTPGGTKEDYSRVNILVAIIRKADASQIESYQLGWFDESKLPDINIALAILSFLLPGLTATAVLAGGSYWSGWRAYNMMQEIKELRKAGVPKDKWPTHLQQTTDNVSRGVMIFSVVLMLVMITTWILLLFFFYDIFVYVMMFIFSLYTVHSMHFAISTLLDKYSIATASFRFYREIKIRSLFIVPLCLGFVIAWFLTRKESYNWVLLDIMGVVFCTVIISSIHFPNLKFLTGLLIGLFIYDIFFVFITPEFTSNGVSIMEQIATGQASRLTGSGGEPVEQLPLLLKFPSLSKPEALDACPLPISDYSMLGFGDIVLPGLLVSYAAFFDRKVGNKRPLYYISNVTAYAVSLVMTVTALILMKTAQPALLYIVPTLLLVNVLLAWRRNELRHYWTGRISDKPAEGSDRSAASSDAGDPPQSSVADDTAVLVSDAAQAAQVHVEVGREPQKYGAVETEEPSAVHPPGATNVQEP